MRTSECFERGENVRLQGGGVLTLILDCISRVVEKSFQNNGFLNLISRAKLGGLNSRSTIQMEIKE